MKKIFNFQFSIFNSRGFTIPEMLVAISLFAVVVSIAAGGFVNALRSQRQVAALIAADNNVSLALEQIAREMRTGYNFCRTTDPVTGNPVPACHDAAGGLTMGPVAADLAFVNANVVAVTYRLNNGVIERIEGCGTLSGCGPAVPITGGNVVVKYLNFILFGNLAGDGWPPRITISIGISPKEASVSGVITRLQTTISARQLDS